MTATPFRILITHDLYDSFRQELHRKGEPAFEWIRVDFDAKPANFQALLAEADVLVSRVDLTDAEFAVARRLKLFQLPIAGYDQIDLGRIARLGIPLANNAGANAVSVAEHFFLVVLALYRHVFHHQATVLDGSWVNLKHQNAEMFGKTVGIVGLGCVGRQVAARCLAFGMQVQYYDIRHAMEGFETVDGAVFQPLEALVRSSDILTFHVPLTRATAGMIGERLLSWMPPHAILVNLSRGEIQDEAAMERALRAQRIAGVAVDVFCGEPPDPSLPLLAFGRPARETQLVLGKPASVNVVRAVFSPHCGPSAATRLRVVDLVADNVRRVYRGLAPRARVIDYEALNAR
jgi:phosphoglycerate dehydrogenase-like enzyme